MAFLTLNGTPVPCALQAQSQGTPRLIGERATAFSGRTRSTVRGYVRTWSLATPPIPLADARALELALASQYPLVAGGDLVDGIDTPVIGQLDAIRHRKYADGERAVVEFTLQDAEPYQPILYWLRADRTLPAGAAFARASSAWYVDRDGILREAGSNVPRVEWLDLDGDGVRETPTVLLEPAATNLLLWSEALDTWSQTGLTVSPNATTAPDGQATADRLTEDTATGQHLIMQSASVDAGDRAFSIYLRADGRRYASLYPQGAASGWAIFDLQAGAVAQTGGANLVRAYIDDAIKIAGGVWYRCVVVVRVTAPGTLRLHVYLTTSASNPAPSYTGSGTLGVYAWGAQLEASSVATSYVPTTASTVSRAADVLTFPWPHAPQPMTGYLRFIERGAVVMIGASRVLLQIGTGVTRPRLWVRQTVGQGRYGIGYELDADNSVTSLLPASPVPAIGDRVELLWRLYADGSVQIEQSINGGTPVVAARSSAIGLPAAWSGQVMRLSGVPTSSGNEAPAAWKDAVVLRGAGWTMDDVRRLVA